MNKERDMTAVSATQCFYQMYSTALLKSHKTSSVIISEPKVSRAFSMTASDAVLRAVACTISSLSNMQYVVRFQIMHKLHKDNFP